MDTDSLIKNWHAKASEDDYFSKFIFEYLAFIAFLEKRKFTNTRLDREAIQKLKRDQQTRDQYFNDLQNNNLAKEAWGKIINELNNVRLGNVNRNGEGAEEIRWWNCSHNQLDSKTQIEKEKVSGVIHGLDDWENMIEFWYSIRNNLFHGGKDPQDNRDLLVVENGYKTLNPLMEIFLNREQNSMQ
ncbi:MAG: hypothetical protein HYV42_04135 [Candidatus Magasanikbacteria bacterium]|nr:hypothetical protein [Candidatus Magasanikbacteria bacterium]